MRALLVAALLAITCCSCAMASGLGILLDEGSPYSAMVVGTQVGSQLNNWTYTLVNTSIDDNYAISCMQLEVDEDTLVSNVITPTGWIANWRVPHIIQWTTGSSLAASSAQTGFEVIYDREPAYQNWTVNLDNAGDPDDRPVYFGLVESPEPASLAVMIAGLVPFVGFIRRRRV